MVRMHSKERIVRLFHDDLAEVVRDWGFLGDDDSGLDDDALHEWGERYIEYHGGGCDGEGWYLPIDGDYDWWFPIYDDWVAELRGDE